MRSLVLVFFLVAACGADNAEPAIGDFFEAPSVVVDAAGGITAPDDEPDATTDGPADVDAGDADVMPPCKSGEDWCAGECGALVPSAAFVNVKPIDDSWNGSLGDALCSGGALLFVAVRMGEPASEAAAVRADELAESFGDAGLVVVISVYENVNQLPATKSDVIAWAAGRGLSALVGYDPTAAFSSLTAKWNAAPQDPPVGCLVGRDLWIRKVWSGEIPMSVEVEISAML